MARTRIKGKNITFEFGTPAVAYECDLISAVLSRGDAPNTGTDGVVTFCDAGQSAGGQIWLLDIEALQSTDVTAAATGTQGQPGYVPAVTESLHTLLWNEAAKAGGGEIPFTFKPHANSTATEAQPHYKGTITVPGGDYPSIGGAAGDNSWTFTKQFVVKDNLVTKVTS